MGETSSHVAIKKQDGAEFQWLGETLKRWGECAKECFSKSQDRLKPRREREHIRRMGERDDKATEGAGKYDNRQNSHKF